MLSNLIFKILFILNLLHFCWYSYCFISGIFCLLHFLLHTGFPFCFSCYIYFILLASRILFSNCLGNGQLYLTNQNLLTWNLACYATYLPFQEFTNANFGPSLKWFLQVWRSMFPAVVNSMLGEGTSDVSSSFGVSSLQQLTLLLASQQLPSFLPL